RNRPRTSRLDLRVVTLDRARHDHHIRLAQVIGAMALLHAAPDRSQVPRDLRIVHVRAGDPVAHVREHLGDAAHPHAANADEMDLRILLAEHGPYRINVVPEASHSVDLDPVIQGISSAPMSKALPPGLASPSKSVAGPVLTASRAGLVAWM